MNWRGLMKSNLGDLLRGRVSEPKPKPVRPPRPEGTTTRIPAFGTLVRAFSWLVFMPLRLIAPTKRHDLLIVTELLARITACNAPLIPALRALVFDAPNGRVSTALAGLINVLEQGWTLSDAMRGQDYFFPAPYVDLVEIGEKTGTLHKVLLQLAGFELEHREIRAALRATIAYVFTIFLLGFAISTFLMIKVVPVFQQIISDFSDVSAQQAAVPGLFSGKGVALSEADEVILGVGTGLLMVMLVLSIVLWRWRPFVRLRLTVSLHVPVMRRLALGAQLAQASRILQRLFEAQCPAEQAFESASNLDIAPRLQMGLLKTSDHLRHGQSIQEALDLEKKAFPRSFRAMVALGEAAGNLPEYLSRIATLYEARMLRLKTVLGSLVLPLAVLAVGGWVMVLTLSMFHMLIAITTTMLEQI